MVLGFLTIVFGGLGVFLYYLHDLIVNFDTLSRDELFWSVVWLFFRDIVPIVVGLIFLGIGYVIKKD